MAKAKIGVVVLDMGQHIPEERLSHTGVSYAVCMGEAISAGRCRTANGGQDTRMITECISHIIERQAMCNLYM